MLVADSLGRFESCVGDGAYLVSLGATSSSPAWILAGLVGVWWIAREARRVLKKRSESSRLERSMIWLVFLTGAFIVAFPLANWLGLSVTVVMVLFGLACVCGVAAAVVSFLIGWRGDPHR